MPYRFKRKLKRKVKKSVKKVKLDREILKIVKRHEDKTKELFRFQSATTLSTIGNLVFSSTGSDLLASFAQGTSQTFQSSSQGPVQQQLLGLNMRIKRVHIRGQMIGASATGTESGLMRLMVVLDEQGTNNTLLQWFNISNAYDNIILTTGQINAPVYDVGVTYKGSSQNQARVHVLYDKVYTLNQGYINQKPFDISINMHDMLINFFPSGGGTNFAYFNKRLYFYYLSQTASGNAQQLEWMSDVEYYNEA